MASRPELAAIRAVNPTHAEPVAARDAAVGVRQTAVDGPKVWNLTIRPRQATIFVTYRIGDVPLDQASAANPANYRLSLPLRPANQSLAVTSATVASPAGDGTQTVTLRIGNGRRLLHGAYKITIVSGGVRDTQGRALDGEFLTNRSLPSGNGLQGGNFTAILPTNSQVAFRPETPGDFKFFGFAPFPRR